MNTHNNIFSIIKTYLPGLLSAFFCLIIASCAEEPLMDDNTIVRPGTGNIGMTVSYYPNVTTDVQSRSAGNAVEKLNSLMLVVFDEDGSFVRIYDEKELQGLDKNLTHNDQPTMSDEDKENNGSWTEGSQAKAEFRLVGLPFGAYKIYCVANFHVTPDMAQKFEGEDYETDEKKLLATQLTWNPNNIGANNAMFGYFTKYENKQGDTPLMTLSAPVVTINKTDVKLHAWVKRAVSKVTVAFDPSGLHQNVSIFIHKVTIKDIPKTCSLGEENSPKATLENRSQVLHLDGETIFFNAKGEAVSTDPGDGDANRVKWLELNNGTGVKGSDHKATSPALFFFENMQGDYKDMPAGEREAYNKEPKAGWVHEYLERPDEHWERRPWDYDTKDKIDCGTYIEVEGFYESTNDLNTTSGPIKYRFMLGKNTTYNYNAQRNHHYKVTLKFNGWANQPEWHIEYVEEKPDLDAPEIFYMPYIYHARVELPIRFIGDISDLKVEIVENDWGPYDFDDETRTGAIATWTEPLETTGNLDDTDAQKNIFMWNKPSWLWRNGISSNNKIATVPDGMDRTYLGFMSLTMPQNAPASVVDDKTFSAGGTALTDLKNLFEGNNGGLSQAVREFNADELTGGSHTPKDYATKDSYDQSVDYYVYAEGNARTLMLPVFTRAKSMIFNSGYSGNNPYEYYSRAGKLRVTATFANGTILTRYIRIVQRPRITNPKAIWKDINSTNNTFKVIMMTRKSDALNTDWTPFKSDGSWTAEILVDPVNNFTLEPGPDCTDESTKTKLVGKTKTRMEFTIKFGGKAACGIVTVRYHGEKCVHHIFVRQGYDPIQVNDGGATWLSYNLQHGGNGTFNTTETSTGATLVDYPLSFGSYFKRKALSQGIDESNNDTYTVLKRINGKYLKLGNNPSEQTTTTWSNISGKWLTSSQTNPNKTTDAIEWQQIKVGNNTYDLPVYNDFQHLTKNAEFGFGICYGDAATETKEKFIEATGYAQMWKPETAGYGVRGVVVYNRNDARQIIFPLSASGYGRRHVAYISTAADCGRLLYSDIAYRLDNSRNENNKFRPIPYNMPYSNGAIYWIKKIDLTGHIEGNTRYPCGGWDMNYFNFDFNAYTANCLYKSGSISSEATGSDALPIRLVSKHATETAPR